jgi:para-nitrobenzyl esterase
MGGTPVLSKIRIWVASAGSAVALAVGLVSGAQADKTVSATAVVETTNGPIRGITKDGMDQFLGIPFAAPPVGNLRWEPPQEPKPWSHVLDVDKLSKTCVQTNTLGVFAEPSLNEDCLYLNVYRPGDKGARQDGAKRLPVMVWIHGGGWFDGSANEYNPAWLVKKGDTVFVSINYRLNIFGFFAPPSVKGKDGPIGNYGFMDQQQALKWVKRNISKFGGDPDNVTIFGESAGGGSVMSLIVSPGAKGLFHRAIVESGSYVMVSPFQSLAQARAYGEDFAKAVGCEKKTGPQTLDCLKKLTTKQIVERARSFTDVAQAIVDGQIIPRTIPEALAAGEFAKVPVINGANRDELNWSVGMEEAATGKRLKASEYRDRVRGLFGDEEADRILPRYKPDDFGSPSEAFGALQGDQLMLCPLRTLNDALVKHVPVYSFEFADRTAPDPGPGVSFPLGAAHTFELQYIFKNYNGATGAITPLDKRQSRLSEAMVSYWTTFAKSGDPNGPDTPNWPVYNRDEDKHISLVSPVPDSARNFTSRHRCNFWDKYEARKGKSALAAR